MKIQVLIKMFSIMTLASIVSGNTYARATTDVAELTKGYEKIYHLDIPDNASFDVNPVLYSINNSSKIFTKGITRIGYYLELDNDSTRQWVWVSMDAFTQDLTKIGVPTIASRAVWQIRVKNMKIESNVENIIKGSGINTGNIEFWPYNYGRNIELPNIGGNNSLFDFNDVSHGTRNYGSMQIHNFSAGQTLFAYNSWGGHSGYPIGDIGIGNNVAVNTNDGLVHPVWTYLQNADTFTVKSLEIWVQPNENSCNGYTEEDINNAIDKGKQICKNNPSSCGINVVTTTHGGTETGTVSESLDIHMPSLNYTTLLGTQNIWVDFKYSGKNLEEKHIWELKNFGVNQ